MSSHTSPDFGKWRSFFWPIYRHELRLLIPMLGIFFLITFNYNLLRVAKDALVVTAKFSGADTIPFLKTWAVLPMAFLMTFLFTRLFNKFKLEQVFYLMMAIFLGFFLLFAFVLYPLHSYLHPHQLADRLQVALPSGCQGLVAVFRNWTFTAFYVMSELWGTAIMTVLFWGFANQITSVEAAKRFYVILSTGGNTSSIFSGTLSAYIAGWGTHFQIFRGVDAWGNSVMLLTLCVLLTGVVAILLFRRLHRQVLTAPPHPSSLSPVQEESSKIKLGLRKNFSYLLKSRYLLCIAVLVLTYNIAINMTEVVWKDQLRLICPDPNNYQAHMGKVSVGIGFMAVFIALFSGSIIRRFSWTVGAMIPPLILLITGIAFFSFILFENLGLETFALFFSTTPLALGVYFGSLQNCLSRASKYTLFDTTKELAFIPLNRESKLKGKAAIDGIGSRLGKSGSAFIYSFLLIPLGTVSASIPYVALIFFCVIAVWIIAVRSLGKQFNQVMAQKKDISVPETPLESEVLT
jgi:ATP:ADP antiporter, AAA family